MGEFLRRFRARAFPLSEYVFLLMTLLLSSSPSSLWPPPTGHQEMQAKPKQQQQSSHFPKIIINWAKKKIPQSHPHTQLFLVSLHFSPHSVSQNSTASIFQSEVVEMITSRSPAGPLTRLHLPGTVTMKRATAWQLALKPAVFIKQTHAKRC